MALLADLLEAARRVAKHEVESGGGMCHRPNLSLLVRRMRLLLPVFEELRDNSRAVLLLPSAVAAIQQLHSTVLRAAQLVERVRSSSQLWLLAQLHAVCDEFSETTRGVAVSLGLLPLDLLEELPVELKEQIELLRQQAERSNKSEVVEAGAADLHKELLGLLTEFENKKSPNSDRIDHLFKALGLDSVTERRTELEQLQRLSQEPQAASLTNFLCYSSCVLYGAIAEDETAPGNDERQRQQQQQEESKRCSVPDEFKCPISLELMREPVIISSGQTYERTSIQRWLDAGNLTCPKSGQKLAHTTLIPNFALRSLIAQWCERNQVELPQQQPSSSSSSSSSDERRGRRRGDHISGLEAAKVTASFLVGKLATGCPEIQRQAAYELRLLAKTGMDNRRCISDAGAVPLLVSLLQSEDSRTQENAITALLNLSILDSNKPLIMAAGALDPIVDTVLCNGHTSEARENAAATVFSLSTLDEYKAAIGSKEATIPQLLELLRSGSATGTKDAVSALFNLSLLDANRKKVVQAGAVALLVDILEQQLPEKDMENTLALLGLLASSEEGASCILARASAIPTLVSLLESGAEREKENAAAVLLALCKGGDQNAMRRLMNVPGCISALHNLLANGSSRGKRKATSIMRALQKWNP